MDNRLTMGISRQMHHPMASTSADAANCYDRINHIIMAYLLLTITGSVGLITALLFPIQIMKFFQHMGHGDSTTFMGGQNRAMNRLLQGLCQGNGAAPACWLMLSSVLMHCYEREGHGSSVLSPMSMTRMNGSDWMKHFVSHLLHISHSQWLYRNFTLRETTRGYLRLKERQNILIKIDKLLDVNPNNIPPESRFLLEMDFDGLYRSSFEKQSYWVVAMKAAYQAGR